MLDSRPRLRGDRLSLEFCLLGEDRTKYVESMNILNFQTGSVYLFHLKTGKLKPEEYKLRPEA